MTPSPLFRDPVYDGAADPVLAWNRAERSWWMLYTSRRATAPSVGVAWAHGTDIGVASSADRGASWTYRGTLDLEHEFGRNTFWAPEVRFALGHYHLFVTYVSGVPDEWAGHERHIHHYTSADMFSWAHRGPAHLSSSRVIDACVHERPGGGFRMWYKDEADGSTTWAVDSTNLEEWHHPHRVLATPRGHEGPNVFRFRGAYWLIVDTWDGQLAYRSKDASTWHSAGRILDRTSAELSSRADDAGPGLHADVVVDGDRAFVVYFTHPDPSGPASGLYPGRRSSVLVAELGVDEGQLVCNRGREVCLDLPEHAL